MRPSSFNPRSPCGERLGEALPRAPSARFNPRSPCGERRVERQALPGRQSFNPRSPCGERPRWVGALRRFSMFQPTLPLRGATRRGGALRPMGAVSTHAPLAGSDSSASSTPTTAGGFNPRSSCEERREVVETKVKTHRSFQPTLPLRGATQITRGIVPKAQFQPTLPLRGATWTGGGRARRPSCFNPRSPCGERHRMIDRQIRSLVVSTHAPLAGSDRVCGPVELRRQVSTHAPLAGSD